jgi:hypothetical protein
MVEEEAIASHNLVLRDGHIMLSTLLEDPFLKDIGGDCSVVAVQSEIALLQGKAVTVLVNKFDGEVICECMQGWCML